MAFTSTNAGAGVMVSGNCGCIAWAGRAGIACATIIGVFMGPALRFHKRWKNGNTAQATQKRKAQALQKSVL